MKWEIHHRTRYLYATPVKESFNEARLMPVTNEHQTLDSFLLKVLPPSRLRHYLDFHQNTVHHFDIAEPHSDLLIESHAVVTTRPPQAPAPDAQPAPLSRLPEAGRSERCFDFLNPSRFVDATPETWRMAVDATAGTTDIWQAAQAIMRFVYGHLTYVSRSTHVHTQMSETLAQRRGVCQDFAHVMLGLCRAIKIPALYVSGYLATEQASATHAWVEVFIPGIGWVGLDPTHNQVPGETYVKIAVGRDYADVPPVSGTYKGTRDRQMLVEVAIRPLEHLP